MSLWQNICKFVSDLLDEPSHPEAQVQEDMEQRGWEFHFDVYSGVNAATTVLYVKPPGCRETFTSAACGELGDQYRQELNATREKLGFKPR